MNYRKTFADTMYIKITQNNIIFVYCIDFFVQMAYNSIADVKGDVFMAQAMVNFRMDEDLKKSMEQVCKDMGLSMTTAFTIFATRVSKEKRIPFEISADPFYDEFNVQRILAAVANLNAGKGVEHELIEVE